MNGMMGHLRGTERTAIVPKSPAKQQQQQQQQDTTTPASATVHRLQNTPNKEPEPLCILGCCGGGKLMILWTGSDSSASAGFNSSAGSAVADHGDVVSTSHHRLHPTSSAAEPEVAYSPAVPAALDDRPLYEDPDCACSGERLGRIQFSLAYDFQKTTLTLKIIRAVELAAKDITGTSDPYVKVMLLPDKKHKLLTNIKRRNLNPRWNEVFAFEGFPFSKLMSRTLYLQVLDYDRFSRDDPIGEVCLPLSDISLQQEQTLWRTLQPCKGHTGKLGELLLSLCYQPTAECITVIVARARELKAKDINGLSDPYVKIWLLRDGKRIEKRKSTIVEKSLNPVFNETFLFCVPYEHIRQTCLEVSVVDYDRMGRNERIGQVLLGAKSGPMEVKHWNEMFAKSRQEVTQWHILKDFG